jgi:hypothetical protein
MPLGMVCRHPYYFSSDLDTRFYRRGIYPPYVIIEDNSPENPDTWRLPFSMPSASVSRFMMTFENYRPHAGFPGAERYLHIIADSVEDTRRRMNV